MSTQLHRSLLPLPKVGGKALQRPPPRPPVPANTAALSHPTAAATGLDTPALPATGHTKGKGRESEGSDCSVIDFASLLGVGGCVDSLLNDEVEPSFLVDADFLATPAPPKRTVDLFQIQEDSLELEQEVEDPPPAGEPEVLTEVSAAPSTSSQPAATLAPPVTVSPKSAPRISSSFASPLFSPILPASRARPSHDNGTPDEPFVRPRGTALISRHLDFGDEPSFVEEEETEYRWAPQPTSFSAAETSKNVSTLKQSESKAAKITLTLPRDFNFASRGAERDEERKRRRAEREKAEEADRKKSLKRKNRADAPPRAPVVAKAVSKPQPFNFSSSVRRQPAPASTSNDFSARLSTWQDREAATLPPGAPRTKTGDKASWDARQRAREEEVRKNKEAQRKLEEEQERNKLKALRAALGVVKAHPVPNWREVHAAGGDVLQALSGKRRRKQLLQGAAVLVALVLVIAGTRAVLFRRKVSHTANWRKAQLASEGTGESFVLPKAQEDDTVERAACKRVLLFKFGSEMGFGHEFQAYIRAHVMAQKLSYTLLADDTEWNYGSLREYFLPKLVHCKPPADWFLKEAAVPLGSKRWANEDRVWFSTELSAKADDWIRSETLDASAMRELHSRTYGHILPQGQTLPSELEDVFSDFAAAVKEIWKPNDQLSILIRSLRMELGLGAGGLRNRKNSPAWGGARRKGDDSRRLPVEDVAEDDHDYDEAGGAERSDRGPLIGAHFRSPRGERAAQWTEDMSWLGAKNQQFGNLTMFLEGAKDAVGRLSKSSIAEPGYSRTAPVLFPANAEVTLLVMTAEADVVPSLEARSDVVDNYTVKRTSLPPPAVLKQWSSVLGYERNAEAGDGGRSSILSSFDQETFNALPRNLRVTLTRYFLRDLTTLSLYADSFLVTASSNIGRLACLIAGEEAVLGPRAFDSGHGMGGRVRSLDAPWHPMGSAAALFAE
ncbi:hypothetical protein RQP46_006451 [Phenoliferia psychrophenolica]